MALIAFILTDCVQKTRPKEDRVELVRAKSLTNEEMIANYVPLCIVYMVGETDDFGKVCKGIVGDEKSITVSGVIMVGQFPRPFHDTFTVGKSFSAPALYEEDTLNLIDPVVTAIVIAEDEEDTEGIVNHYAQLNTEWERDSQSGLKMAEQVLEEVIALCYDCSYPIHMDDEKCKGCGSWDWEDTDFFGAEYELEMENLAYKSYPQNRLYESTV